MLRTSLATALLTALLASTSLAGDCLSCGSGAMHGGRSWDNYCGGDVGGCGNSCDRCFPLIHCTLHKIGRVVDFLIPDPCCRRGCGYAAPTVGCCQPTCGMEPGCGAVGYPTPAGNPFLDDAPPTPMPMKDARARSMWGSPKMTHRVPAATARPTAMQPRSVLQPIPMKTAAASPKATKVAKPVVNGKMLGQSVLKVGYEQETFDDAAGSDIDAPPAAPASIRNVSREPAVHVATKPVVRARESQLPVNPLRP